MGKRPLFFVFFALWGLLGCAGEDYTPVYFPGLGAASEGETTPPPGADLNLAQCTLELTAQLCVKIKGQNMEVGTDPDRPLCADTPPIHFEIDGERLILRGRDFPDINVAVEVRGIDTPMTINGKGMGDGVNNVGEGSWTPDGDLLIQDFSFFVNVLGMTGEIPHIDLTTDTAREVPSLPSLSGRPVDPSSGDVVLTAATVLGPLFPAADEFLLGASLQAAFEGTLTPALSECAPEAGVSRNVTIVKLRPAPGGQAGEWMEEPLPEGNILEVSRGVMIAVSPDDTGEDFEETARFRVLNQNSETLTIEFPFQIGPFYFLVEGMTRADLAPRERLDFEVAFRPDASVIPGKVEERWRAGGSTFVLNGIALPREGNLNVHRREGSATLADIETAAFGTQTVDAVPVRKYFHCEQIECSDSQAVTRCEPCEGPDGCTLHSVNAQDHPIGEVDENCQPLYSSSVPQMTLRAGHAPRSQTLTVQNDGIGDLEIQSISIEELENSRSTGEFFAGRLSLPLSLSAGASLSLVVSYQPKDLIGFDGRMAAVGEPARDRAYLVLNWNSGTQRIGLWGLTEVQQTPLFQAYFATPTGYKARRSMEPFNFEEVTAATQDIAAPVFFHVGESAAHGVRITEIKIEGEDAARFEWLDSAGEVESRRPPSGAGRRCSIPVFDPQTGGMINERFDLRFAPLGSQGYDLHPAPFSESNRTLFGCINFHRDPNQNPNQRIFTGRLTASGFLLDPQGRLVRGPDGNFQQTSLAIPLTAAIDPVRGKMVLRISQTVAAILNPQSPSLTAVAAQREIELMRQAGIVEKPQVLWGALILDPFDEMPITDTAGQVVSEPNDGITGVFRAVDTRPTPETYESDFLFDHATLLHDAGLGASPGIFYDYGTETLPLPEDLKVNGWRIFTGALSYPGPLSPRNPITQGECDVIDPCSPEGLRQLSAGGIGADGKGACAFFFASGARYDSGAFQPVIAGEGVNLCDQRESPQELLAMNTGHYALDGSITFEDIGFRFWGPTYIHNPHGPLGFKPPLDEVFHIAFTTEVLRPDSPNAFDLIPDEKIDAGRLEHKINLTDETLPTPPICPKNTDNRFWGGRRLSSWRYFAPLLFKDEAGTIPAGCPEPGNHFSGGTAFLKGRRLDPETKTFTLVATAKFGSREDLSLAFKNVMVFTALNGWVCDPQGSREDFEGAACFNPEINERDEAAQISIMED